MSEFNDAVENIKNGVNDEDVHVRPEGVREPGTAMSSDEYKLTAHSKVKMCPRCRSTLIQRQDAKINVDGVTLGDRVMCEQCDFMWEDVYTLSGYRDGRG